MCNECQPNNFRFCLPAFDWWDRCLCEWVSVCSLTMCTPQIIQNVQFHSLACFSCCSLRERQTIVSPRCGRSKQDMEQKCGACHVTLIIIRMEYNFFSLFWSFVHCLLGSMHMKVKCQKMKASIMLDLLEILFWPSDIILKRILCDVCVPLTPSTTLTTTMGWNSLSDNKIEKYNRSHFCVSKKKWRLSTCDTHTHTGRARIICRRKLLLLTQRLDLKWLGRNMRDTCRHARTHANGHFTEWIARR